MALKVKVDDWDLPSASSGTSAHSGYGFQPGFTFGHSSKLTGSTSQLLAKLSQAIGMSVGTSTITKFAGYTGQNDNASFPSCVDAMHGTRFFEFMNEANPDTVNGYGGITHDADGATTSTDATTDNFDAAYRARSFSIDSAGISNSKLYTITSPTVTGNDVHTDVGFQADLLVFWATGISGDALPRIHQTAGADSVNPPGLTFGACDGALNMWVLNAGHCSEGGSGDITAARYFLTTKCIAAWDMDANSGGADTRILLNQGSVTAISSTGYTINWDTVDAAGYIYNVLALKMAASNNVAVGNVTSPTTAIAFSKTGMSFQPSGLLLCSPCRGVDTAGTLQMNDLTYMLGMTDGTASRSASYYSKAVRGSSGSGLSISKTYFHITKVLQYRSLGTSTAVEEIDFTSFNSDGFTFTSTTAPATGSLIGFIAFGPGTSAAITVGEMDAACSTSSHTWVPGNLTRMIPSGSGGGRR